MPRTIYFTTELWERVIEDETPGMLLAAALNSTDEGVFFREIFDDGFDDISAIIFESSSLCERVENAYRRIRSQVVFWHLDKVEDLVTGESEVDPPIVICEYFSDLFEVTAAGSKFVVNWYTGRKYQLGNAMTEEEVRDFLF